MSLLFSVPGVVKKSSAPDSASSAVVIAANAGAAKAKSDFDAVVGDVAKTSLTAGGPPTMPVISNSEKTQAPAGLGEGSPKVRWQMISYCLFGIIVVCGFE